MIAAEVTQVIYDHSKQCVCVCDFCIFTLHIEQLVLYGDLRGALGHSLAV